MRKDALSWCEIGGHYWVKAKVALWVWPKYRRIMGLNCLSKSLLEVTAAYACTCILHFILLHAGVTSFLLCKHLVVVLSYHYH